MSSVPQLFETLQPPQGLEKGIYEGYVLRSVPEVADGDFVFASGEKPAHNISELKQVKSVA